MTALNRKFDGGQRYNSLSCEDHSVEVGSALLLLATAETISDRHEVPKTTIQAPEKQESEEKRATDGGIVK
ncbi:hypothetical protein T265_05722 [Opisthorchis viverrini]|uniref:Uncharacterized protein n=1 Tax=Opisthorchis viverrini TaxID=6198 RepID=A0A074ZIQ2_OPIVI|nr:hypothetical protein T265_05722 [Opisthorchis viverrini]KER27188.1 hypothetical protein T265_05722 [Opisthorchis viverrini]